LTYLRQRRTVVIESNPHPEACVTIDRETFEVLLDTARVLRRKRRERVSRLLGMSKPASRSSSSESVDARAIRLVTGLSQAKFAELLGIELSTLRNWEQGRRQPTGPAQALLRAIRNNPVEVIKALTG
jgi:putative transcriptional regulator